MCVASLEAPTADELWQAHELEGSSEEIEPEKRPSLMRYRGSCSAHDLRLLALDGRLTDAFINTVPVLGNLTGSHAYLLPTFTFSNIRKRKFDLLDQWVKKACTNCKQWIFGAHQGDHWMAARIDWSTAIIQHYDPKSTILTDRSKRMLAVSTKLIRPQAYIADGMQEIEAWTKYQSKSATPWTFEPFRGPLQHALDSENCGVYVSWVLRQWIQGAEDDAKTQIDPLDFKLDILKLLRESPRVSRVC